MQRKGFVEINYQKWKRERIGVGVLGYGFMGKVHSNAYLKIPFTYEKSAAWPELVAMCGRNTEAVEDTARRFGYRGVYADWRELVQDPQIRIFDNCSPDDRHCEPSIAAAKAGKHVLCEKPLAMTVNEARAMVQAVKAAGVKHMVCHNYRFLPAV